MFNGSRCSNQLYFSVLLPELLELAHNSSIIISKAYYGPFVQVKMKKYRARMSANQ